MKLFSIKSKLLLAFAVLLTIITLLNVLQTSYVINRRGEEEAFEQLSRQLTLFQQELRDFRKTQIAVALDAARDDKNLSDLAILYAQKLKSRQQSGTALERTLSLNKAVSSNRLQLILDSARLSSVAVYIDSELSHYVTRDGAGMVSLRDGREVLIGASQNKGENVQLSNWRTWPETTLPVLVTRHAPVVDRVTITFEFPTDDLVVLRIVVPVQGVLRESFLETIVERMTLAAPETRRAPQYGDQMPQVIGMFAFSQTFDTTFLREIADRTGMAPAIFSPDGQHALQLYDMDGLPPALLTGPAQGFILTRTIEFGGTSYYQAFTAWQIDGEPVLVLGCALSRKGTLTTIRQTITSITITAGMIFLIVGLFGYLVLTRMVASITALTAAVSGIGLNRARELEPARREMTLHIALGHYLEQQITAQPSDEIGELTCAFNAMAGELYDQIGNLETQVQERTAQLEAANKELKAFAYTVSHDLRAPLRHIDGFLGLLQKSAAPVLDEQSRYYMDIISQSALHMGALIEDLLSYSRMGISPMSWHHVDLAGLTREVIQEFEPETVNRNIDWRIGDLPVVTGDRIMLRLVLVNLISNALKFTRLREQTEIEIGWLRTRETETVIFVRDNGVGFDEKYGDKLFSVFQRLHRVEEFEGTGIGLANVRRIINRHGGRTWATGELDQGATFYFSLPQACQGGSHGSP